MVFNGVVVVMLIILLLVCLLAIVSAFLVVTIFSSAPWVPTPKPVSRAMCVFGKVKKGETILDLGCGDASMLILAAKEFGVKGVGIELNHLLVLYARLRVRLAGVQHLVTITRGNMFSVDLPDVDKVFLYLLPKAMDRLLDHLQARYPHITVISHGFRFDKLKPLDEKTIGKIAIRKYHW